MQNFCRDPPAFWRRSSFVTLAFPNGLEYRNFGFVRAIGIISIHPVEIWWDSVQWPQSLRHKKLYSRRRREWHLLFASAFDNGLAYRKSAFNRFNGNNQATSYLNLVNFLPTISEFSLLKRAIFAAICPQFDDDLHPSRGRLKTDWSITILISAE